MKKLHDILFKIFWKTENRVVGKKLQVVITPRFGKLGVISWYALTSKCEYIVEENEC